MLGNQYFMTRNYYGAQKELEEVLLKYPDNNLVKKKVIVCYTQTGKVGEAFHYFLELVKENIDLIVKTDPIRDDCPCPELIEKLNSIGNNIADEYNSNLIMGILWLYCDVKKSAQYFNKLKELDSQNLQIDFVLTALNNYILKNC